MKLQRALLGAAAAVMMAGSALAANITQQYVATSATGSGSDHSLWIKNGLGGGIGSDFDFIPAGKLTQFDDDTMTLKGSTVSQSNASAGIIVDFLYDKNFGFTPSFKSENGSQPGTDIEYWNLSGGTLTGTGLLAGLNLTVTRMPATGPFATQLGSSNGTNVGPNNKNMNMGLANWFTINVGSNCTSTYCTGLDGRQGDINIDLVATPLPAGIVLLLSGLGGLAMARRRRT